MTYYRLALFLFSAISLSTYSTEDEKRGKPFELQSNTSSSSRSYQNPRELRGQLAHLKAQNRALNILKQRKAARLEEKKEEIANVNSQIIEKRNQKEVKIEQLSDNIKQIEDVKDKITDTKTELDALTAKHFDLLFKIGELSEQIDLMVELRDIEKNLKNLIEEKNERLAEKSSSSGKSPIPETQAVVSTKQLVPLKSLKVLIGQFYQDPAPHDVISFKSWKKLSKRLREIFEEYGSKATENVKGSHFKTKIQTSVDIFGELIKLGEAHIEEQNQVTPETMAVTVVRKHKKGSKNPKLSKKTVMLIRESILEPLGITPSIFDGNNHS